MDSPATYWPLAAQAGGFDRSGYRVAALAGVGKRQGIAGRGNRRIVDAHRAVGGRHDQGIGSQRTAVVGRAGPTADLIVGGGNGPAQGDGLAGHILAVGGAGGGFDRSGRRIGAGAGMVERQGVAGRENHRHGQDCVIAGGTAPRIADRAAEPGAVIALVPP